MDCEKMQDEKRITESELIERSSIFGTNSTEGFADVIRFMKMDCERMKDEKRITESELIERLNVNVEKEITESEIIEMFQSLKTRQERDVFLGSSFYRGWERKRDQLYYEDCAKIGLAQYNAQNGTNFELVKISRENHRICPGVVYFHLNFIAESSDGSNDEKKSCMFFAEVVGFEERVVSVCCILDLVAGTDGDCRYCGDLVSHPRGCSFHGSGDTVSHPRWCSFHGCRFILCV